MPKTLRATVDTTNCDREPIHIPGAIQPFGVLIALQDREGLPILRASENAADLLEHEIIGKHLCELITEQSFDELFRCVVPEDFDPRPIALYVHRSPDRDELYPALVHRHHGQLLLELEKPATCQAVAEASLYEKVNSALTRLLDAPSTRSLTETIADAVKEITGFDGVMVYQFHDDLHGEVVAEAKSAPFPRYLGLHFPASDIPSQARDIFRQNWLRMIPDVDYTPAPIASSDSAPAHPLDLSRSLLRSVSPIHIEYLKNMGVKASLTLSVIKSGELWGLIACHHHRAPKHVPYEVRRACEILAKAFSSELALREEREFSSHRDRLRAIQLQLLAAVGPKGHVVADLIAQPTPLLELTGSHGAAAAVYVDDHWETVGTTPNVEQIQGIAQWLASRGEEPVFSTDSLPSLYPPARAFAENACGVLAISIPRSPLHYVMWFRPQFIRTITWAGDPTKPVTVVDNGPHLHPRTSFDAWTETVKLRAVPWKPWEIDAAEELRNAILGLDLRRQVQREQEARAAAERATQQREELLAIVSHDLRNPLSSIKLSLRLLKRTLPQDSLAKERNSVGAIERSIDRMQTLINDLLAIAKLEAGPAALTVRPQEVTDVLIEAAELLRPIAVEREVTLKVEYPHPSLKVSCDRDKVLQVFSNLIGNALKFTSTGGSVTVRTTIRPDLRVCFSVSDTGPGIPKEHLPFVFDRYWQAQQTHRLGTGLGLVIAKGIVEAHGGEIGVESEVGEGSTFFFTLALVKDTGEAPR